MPSISQVVDYSWARPAPAAIKAGGFVGAVRYLSYEPGKNISPGEWAGLRNEGLALSLVWETTADRALHGAGAGAQDAIEANRQANALGYTGAIYYAVDTGATWEQVAPYFRGVASVQGLPWGGYGPYAVAEGLGAVTRYVWQCAAWSGTGRGSGGSVRCGDGSIRPLSQYAVLFQDVGYVLGGTCDRNFVYSTNWGQHGVPINNPVVITEPSEAKDDDVPGSPVFKFPDGRMVYIGGDEKQHPIVDPHHAWRLRRVGIISNEVIPVAVDGSEESDALLEKFQ